MLNRVFLLILPLAVLSGNLVMEQQPPPTRAVNPSAVISVENAGQIELQTILKGNAPWMLDMEFSPDGHRLAVAETGDEYHGFKDVQGKVHIWDTSSWQEEMTLGSNDLSAMSLSFSRDGNYLAVGNTTGEIQLWHVNFQELGQTLEGHDTWVNALTFGPGGGLLVSGSGALYATDTAGDSTVRLWLISGSIDVQQLAFLVPENANLGAGLSANFSPDGSLVAAGMTNGTVHLWGVETKKEYAVLDGYGWADDLFFTPDSSQIIYAANDGVHVWNIASAIKTKGNVPAYKLIAPLKDKDFIFSIALSPDGTVLAAGYQDGTVRLWNVETGDQLTVLEGHKDRVVSLAFSPDGTLLASGGTDGTVRLWGIPPK